MEYNYVCSDEKRTGCQQKVSSNGPQEFCLTCGSKLVQKDSPEIDNSPKPQIEDSVNTTRISAKEVQEILPEDVKLKEIQNPECNAEGHFCGVFRGTDACIEPILKEDKDGNVELVKLKPCAKTGLEGFEVES